MLIRSFRLLSLGCAILVLFACSREPEPQGDALLRHVPADTPYAFVVSRQLPDKLRERMGSHYAAQLASQRQTFARALEQIEGSEQDAQTLARARGLFAVLDALFAEFEGRDSAAQLRELGIEPVPRSVIYGLGPLPAMHIEIVDRAKLNALLDRVEQRAGVEAQRGELAGQPYRRIDVGSTDAVLAVSDQYLIAGLLADTRFDQDLPLLLGQVLPQRTLAESGEIAQLIARHGFTGYGEGFIRIDELAATLFGEGGAESRAIMQAVGFEAPPVSEGCMRLTRELVAGMPRMVMGVTAAEDDRFVIRGIWESTPDVARYLQKLAAPVPGVGALHDGLLAMGIGIDLPELRNAIDALLRKIASSESGCEWVDRERLQAITPQLNLALGPMTAGIKGFNLQIEDLTIDPQTMEATDVKAGLLAAVDDPRGIFALGAMFNPGLAALQVPDDGSFVELPRELALDESVPPMQVAIKDRALLLLAGGASAELGNALSNAAVVTPSPLFAVDYGVHQLVERFGSVMDAMVAAFNEQGQAEAAVELESQFDSFRVQALFFDRLRVALYASDQGLVIDEEVRLRQD